MPTHLERWLPRLFQLSLVLVLALGAWQCRHGWPVSTDLLELLPHAQGDSLQRRAQARIQEPMARQLIALVGARERELAVGQAKALGERMRASGLFERVQTDYSPDLSTVRAALLAGRIAMLPAAERRLLETAPAVYAARRAREAVDPFSSVGLVPLDQDWLGLARKIEAALRPGGKVQYDMASGTLQAEEDGRIWVLVRAEIHGDAFDSRSPQRIANLLLQADQELSRQQTRLLAAGGPIYADAGRRQAASESSLIGAGSILGIVLVILFVLRRWQALLAFAPVAIGLLFGSVACVAVFGHVHMLTLVVGISLIGFVVDFPMHWLGKSYGIADWQAWPVMRRVLPGLSISLATSLVGYLALAFTPFPALTQVAVFSTAGLLGAYACTVCQMPAWFSRGQPRPRPGLIRVAQVWLAVTQTLRDKPKWLATTCLAAGLLCVAGIARLDLRDDLRQWLSLPTSLLQQARQIGEITGFMPTSQFFLVRAQDDDTLLRRLAQLSTSLDQLKARQGVSSYLSLSQLAVPMAEQRHTQQRLAELATQDEPWQSFAQVGIPVAAIQAELSTLASLPPLSIDAVLAGPEAEPWRGLWLGHHEGQSASLVTLQGLRSTEPLAGIAAATAGVSLVDQNGDLNRMFTTTRVEAALLKLGSYILAALLLWATLGRHATWRILTVPLAATACTLGALGLLGQPLTLFSLFGLLLVSAIGVDYAIFMHEHVAGLQASLVGIMLAAACTLLSFGLLSFSSTPAIANFGLTVALGTVFCLCMAPWITLSPTRNPPHGSP